uniref:Uncharacterized protein n=1 Tax=Solanum lycopersicum TaxID=4081 RepID=A0A3Q7GFB6_SOLLC
MWNVNFQEHDEMINLNMNLVGENTSYSRRRFYYENYEFLKNINYFKVINAKFLSLYRVGSPCLCGS